MLELALCRLMPAADRHIVVRVKAEIKQQLHCMHCHHELPLLQRPCAMEVGTLELCVDHG